MNQVIHKIKQHQIILQEQKVLFELSDNFFQRCIRLTGYLAPL